MQSWKQCALCLPGYHHNGFVTTHALGHMMCRTVHHVPKCISHHKAIGVVTGRGHCFHDCKYVYIYIYYMYVLYIYVYICIILKQGYAFIFITRTIVLESPTETNSLFILWKLNINPILTLVFFCFCDIFNWSFFRSVHLVFFVWHIFEVNRIACPNHAVLTNYTLFL